MKLHFEWGRPVPLRDASKKSMIYALDLNKVPTGAGIYIFGRRWGKCFEALYIGRAHNVQRRVKQHLNNLRLMHHLRDAKAGKRLVLTGRLRTKPGQSLDKCLALAERAFIRYFLSEGHDLVNKQGTSLRRHEVESSGRHPKRFFPKLIYVESTKK